MKFKNLFYLIVLHQDLYKHSRHLISKKLPPDAIEYEVSCGRKTFTGFLKGKIKIHIDASFAGGFYKVVLFSSIRTPCDMPETDGHKSALYIQKIDRSSLKSIRLVKLLLATFGLIFFAMNSFEIAIFSAVGKEYSRNEGKADNKLSCGITQELMGLVA